MLCINVCFNNFTPLHKLKPNISVFHLLSLRPGLISIFLFAERALMLRNYLSLMPFIPRPPGLYSCTLQSLAIDNFFTSKGSLSDSVLQPLIKVSFLYKCLSNYLRIFTQIILSNNMNIKHDLHVKSKTKLKLLNTSEASVWLPSHLNEKNKFLDKEVIQLTTNVLNLPKK